MRWTQSCGKKSKCVGRRSACVCQLERGVSVGAGHVSWGGACQLGRGRACSAPGPIPGARSSPSVNSAPIT
jgi:hypothetical protein